MTNTQEITIRVDRDNELASEWLDRLLECTRHPLYQNGIQLVRARETEKEH